MTIDTADHIAALRREGDWMAQAVASTPTDAPVPTCPEWTLRDLVDHTGRVHRWATIHVAEASTELVSFERAELAAPGPVDDELESWFRAGHAALVEALVAAPPDLECFTFLEAPSPLAFWARRQAHETAIHRVDAESAAGAQRRPVPAGFAADGIDELLVGFLTRRRSKLRSDEPRSLHVRANDTGHEWLVRISADPPVTVRSGGEADATVSGPAEQLYLLLWNRADPIAVSVDGDRKMLDLWRSLAQVR